MGKNPQMAPGGQKGSQLENDITLVVSVDRGRTSAQFESSDAVLPRGQGNGFLVEAHDAGRDVIIAFHHGSCPEDSEACDER